MTLGIRWRIRGVAGDGVVGEPQLDGNWLEPKQVIIVRPRYETRTRWKELQHLCDRLLLPVSFQRYQQAPGRGERRSLLKRCYWRVPEVVEADLDRVI